MDECTVFKSNPDFPGRIGSIKPLTAYKCFDYMRFHAGSYGGYNEWRETLAELAGHDGKDYWEGRCDNEPFADLINFSDCEGTIGPEASAKLAKDFDAFDDKAKSFQSDPWFYDLYQKWRNAFTMAADGGAVAFR